MEATKMKEKQRTVWIAFYWNSRNDAWDVEKVYGRKDDVPEHLWSLPEWEIEEWEVESK